MIILYIIHSITINTETNLEGLNDILGLKVINRENIDDTIRLCDPGNIDRFIDGSVNEWYNIWQEIRGTDDEIICDSILTEEFLSEVEPQHMISF
jgi:hypothetical protein